MFSFLSFLIKVIFNLNSSKRQLIIRVVLLEKEVEIYRRQNVDKRLKINQTDRVIIAILNTHNLQRLIDNLSISYTIEEDKNIFLENLNIYYIESRYTEEISELSNHLSKKKTKEILKETEVLYSWIRRHL